MRDTKQCSIRFLNPILPGDMVRFYHEKITGSKQCGFGIVIAVESDLDFKVRQNINYGNPIDRYRCATVMWINHPGVMNTGDLRARTIDRYPLQTLRVYIPVSNAIPSPQGEPNDDDGA